MKEILSLVLCFVVFFGGCMGRDPHPIQIDQPGDENLSCDTLKTQVVWLQEEMARLLPKTDKFASNALFAGTGVFLIFPYFLMDLKDAEKKEFEAMRQRHNHLLEIIKVKNCDTSDIVAKPIPSLEQQKKAAEEILKESKAAEPNSAK
jgi:hypothetical protein